MPSKLITSVARAFSGTSAVKARIQSLAQQVSQGRQTLTVRGPFLGLVPDVDANLLDGTAFRRLVNCLARAHGEDHGEVLGLPDGFRQVDSARLPLGDTSPPATVTTADPVVRLDQFSRVSPTGATNPGEIDGQFRLTPMAVTAGDGTTNASGNMYRINASNQWVFVGPSTATSAARALKAGRDGASTTSPSMPDSCTAPFGIPTRTGTATAAPGDDGHSGNILEPAWIFTNDVDEVMVFPSSTTESLAGTHTYEPLTNVAALDGGGTNGFQAKSVETWNGRVYFLNTSEANVRRQNRLRRTAKFTANPDPSIVGAGFFDFTEFAGEGLRIETLGDVLAVYFSDGVAFMRPTGVPTSPDEPQIISTERGLLGTHAVVPIGRNVHFGIFTDGWWLLDASGRWQELGIVNLNGKIVPKWRQTFYGDLPADNRHRLYCYYDQPANLIYIARPTRNSPEPEEVWIYDPTSDRCFIENYDVTCFGSFTPLTQAAITIDALPGTIDSLEGTIDSFGAIAGFPKARIHGDQFGFVYSHSRDAEGFHGPEIVGSGTPTVQDPSWLFSMGLRSPAGMRNLSTLDRVSIEYFNHANPNSVSVQAFGPSFDGSQTRTAVLNQGTPEDIAVRDLWFRFTSRNAGLTVSGIGEYHIRALELDLFLDPLERNP